MGFDVKDESVRIRYLKKELSEDQERIFEEYLMEHPEVFEELQTTQILVDSVAEKTFQSNENWLLTGVFSGLKKPLVSFPLGVVSGLAAAAFLSLNVFTVGSLQVHSSANLVFLETTRGAAPPETPIRLDKKDAATLFIQTGDMEETRYQMRLVDSDTDKVLKEQQVVANAAGELVIMVNFTDVEVNNLNLVLVNTTTDNKGVYRLVIQRS